MKKPVTREKVTDIYISLLLSAYILIIAPYTMISEVKYAAFLVLSGAYILAVAALSIKERTFPAPKPLVLLVAGYFLCTAVSAVLSEFDYNPIIGASRSDGLLTQLIYCLTFLSVAAFGRLRDRHIYLFGATMTVYCALSITQFLGLDILRLYPEGMTYLDGNVRYSGEYFGTLGNADFSSVLLGMSAAVMLLALIKKRNFLLFIPLALSLVCLFWARVAEGIVGFFGAAAVMAPLLLGRHGKWVAMAEAALIAAGVIAVFFFDLGGTLGEAHAMLHGEVKDSFGSGRIGIWRAVIGEIPKHPLFGGGVDSMIKWDIEPFSRVVGGKTIYRYIDCAHNEYLNVLAQQGLFAFLCAVGALAYSLRRAIKSGGNIALAGALSYAISAFFGISMFIITPVFLLFLAASVNNKSSEG
ncbi:MAG: O-antigen ligase family protein [Oscillospiraceae bacterium]|nr:O-antigen ligase family protein [Oscillospiraceae bacterium]